MRSRTLLLLALVTLSGGSGCGGSNGADGSNEGASVFTTPDAQTQSESRPAQCSGALPTRFVDGVPASMASPEGTTAPRDVSDLYVDEVVTDSGLLYWTLLAGQDGRIVTASIGQGAPAIVVDETGEGAPTHLAVEGGRLVWLEASASDASLARVMRVATDGWDPRALTGFEPIIDVAYDASAAYVVEGSSIVRVALETGARQLVASVPGAFIGRIAVDDVNVSFVTWSAGQSVVTLARAPKTGGSVTAVAAQSTSTSAAPMGDVATSGAEVFWSLAGAPPRVLATPDDGGVSATLATTEGTATMLRPRGAWLYFTSWDVPTPSLFRLPVQGGTPSLAAPLVATADAPIPGYAGTASRGAIALDATNVYFGGFDAANAPAVFCVAQ